MTLTPFLAGQRVTAGQLNDATQKTLKAIELGTVGTVATTSAATELDVPGLGMTSMPVVNGGLYGWELRLTLTYSVATDVFNVIIRRDSVAGAVISDWVIWSLRSTSQHTISLWDDFTSAATENVSYFVSLQRLSGTGTLALAGQASTSNRSGISLRRKGYASEYQVVV